MVVEAVWKLNMFSLGNQLLSSAEEKEHVRKITQRGPDGITNEERIK
jgi:hypothetical protein